MQTLCQLAHWHTCCTPCNTRANFRRASCWHRCCTPAKPMPTLDMAQMLLH